MSTRVRKAFFNSFGSKIVEAGFSLLAAIVLARILGPSAIGTFAFSMVFIGFSRVLSSLGTSDAIIRTPSASLSNNLVSSIFWLNFTAGLGLAIFFYTAVLVTEELLFKHGSSSVLEKLCWVLLPSALINVPNALLERELEFDKIFYSKLIAYSSSTFLSIYFALSGWGLNALVLQQYAIVCTSLLLALYFTKWTPNLVFSKKDLKPVLGFSGYLTLSKIINYFTKQGDVFLLGIFSSASMVGVYSRGYQLTTSVLQFINGSVIKVFYPLISKKQHHPDEIWRVTNLAVIALSSVYSFLFWIIYYYSNVIVQAVLGSEWLLVADLLPIFCLIAFTLGMAAVFSQILKALGKGALMLKITVACSSATVVCFYVGVHFGVFGLALGYLLGSLILYCSVLVITAFILGTSFLWIFVINLVSGLSFFGIGSLSNLLVSKIAVFNDLAVFVLFVSIYFSISVLFFLFLFWVYIRFYR